ncbi:MAG TPA: hypothetical protein VJN18_34595 [Polyangiaceae bacterium]|nr:hypothetical protein [Polyangiaceae bacterium]
MRITAFSMFAVGLGLAGSHLVACADSAEDCSAIATCGATAGSSSGNAGKSGGGAGNEGGSDGAGSSSGGSQGTSGSSGSSGSSGTAGEGGQGGAGPVECTGDVADDPVCWTTNDQGVFVSSDIGDDVAGNGTREAPYASITKGIASAAGKNVYVCLGAADFYEEKLTITEAVDGVRIYGGFECDNWTHDTHRYVGVQSPEPIALRIQSLKTGAQIENVRFVAADGTPSDKSSFGAFVTDSKGVVLRRVEITAGDGAKGVDGNSGTAGMNGSTAGPAPTGKVAICPNDIVPNSQTGGDWGSVDHCGSVGGLGGTAFKSTANGGPGGPGAPTENVHPLGAIENGGPPGGTGGPGTEGDAGTVGAQASALGTFAKAGFSPANGKAGTDGYSGQGGGGGGASKGSGTCVGASGGAGGMGGCGGKGAEPGLGGGASVGLFSWNSDVTLDASEIVSSVGGGGGGGGDGGLRGQGASGGEGGLGVGAIAQGGDGGDGGNGGDGGSGSGGTGGPSYALVYSGTKPMYDLADTTLTEGDGGDPGLGGSVSDVMAPAGTAGDSAPELEIQ